MESLPTSFQNLEQIEITELALSYNHLKIEWGAFLAGYTVAMVTY